jgi:hypothetical protein
MYHLLDIIVISAAALIAISLAILAMLINRIISMEKGPGRDLVVALTKRAALTSGALIIDPSTLPIPGIGELVTLGSIGLVAYYWWTFFRDDVRGYSKPSVTRRARESSRDIEVEVVSTRNISNER